MVLMNLSARQHWRHRHREESCGHRRRRRGGKGGTNSESNTETYALLYVEQITGGKLLYNTKSSTWCSVTTLEGWDRGWGRVQDGGDTCILMADSCCYMAETNTTLESNYLPIKNKLKKKNMYNII